MNFQGKKLVSRLYLLSESGKVLAGGGGRQRDCDLVEVEMKCRCFISWINPRIKSVHHNIDIGLKHVPLQLKTKLRLLKFPLKKLAPSS